MQVAALPNNEMQRIETLSKYKILDTPPEKAYDDLTKLASLICKTPVALLTFIDGERQWFKSRLGTDIEETPRELSFCAHAILKPSEIMVVDDLKQDDRFFDNPLVAEDPQVRFYAGCPLNTRAGESLGTLCVVDLEPRELTDKQLESLKILRNAIMTQLELRITLENLEETLKEKEYFQQCLETYQQDLEDENLKLAQEKNTDQLTQLYNRRAFDETIEDEIDNAIKKGKPLALLMIDLDNLKQANDGEGHDAGDILLQRIAQALRNNVKKTDFVARYGGDEFAVILPNARAEGAYITAERIRKAAQDIQVGDVQGSLSIGCGNLEEGMDKENFIKTVDQAMYEAKQGGKNKVVVTSTS